ncbi:hypothetical protein Q4488_00945 [Amphritea sp. 1_MG-2023]|nr:hypothetical protein [Amphritea sp. 1_MG-2023]MDO6561939.1 hypothetical protein [Amphritea sp. 1_MG-2023]
MINLIRVIFSECIHSPTLVQDALQPLQQQEQGFEGWISAAIKDNRSKEAVPPLCFRAVYGVDQERQLLASTTDESAITRGAAVSKNC